jgi:hypothetical protein
MIKSRQTIRKFRKKNEKFGKKDLEFFSHANLMLTKKCKEVAKKFSCQDCDYMSCNKYNYEKHLSTDKHKMLTNANEKCPKVAKVAAAKNDFLCECGKKYKHKPSLSRHKQQCGFIKNEKQIIVLENENHETISHSDSTELIISDKHTDNIEISKELIMTIVNENKEFKALLCKQNEIITEQQKQIGELIPKVGNTINNTNNFNLNIFLNEQCKDAITLDEFLKKIEITLPNLMITKNKGLVDGISNIFIENMSKLSIYQRPVHCSDIKRETLYIKQDTWEKDVNKEKVKNAIQKIALIQTKNVKKWNDAYPEFMNNSSQKDCYIQLVKNVMSDIDDKESKIVKNICKAAYVGDKTLMNEP